MATKNYIIKTMTRDELGLAISWAAAEGWNPGLHDAECFYAADPTGFLMGVLDGEPIASISVVKYGRTFGFVGFYIVRPEFRGKGYGLQIWKAGLASLQGRTIGLDGVIEQQENYLKSGFKLAYRNIRYEGIGDESSVSNIQFNIVPLTSLPISTVLEYDKPFFPDDRTPFLKGWLSQPDSYAIGLTHQQTLIGYGVLRICQTGYKIGPLFADTSKFAEAIFLSLRARVPSGSSFYLDVPALNPHAVALAQRYQMKHIFETARMYAPSAPELPINRWFGVTSFELG